MARIGAFYCPGTGHLNPSSELGMALFGLHNFAASGSQNVLQRKKVIKIS
jgi:hypothetical protein